MSPPTAASEARRQKRRRLPHLLAVLSLAPGAIQAFGVQDTLLGGLTSLVVLANLVALRMTRPTQPVLLTIHLLNASLCGYLAYTLAQRGSQGLPYVWSVAAILFLGVFIMQLVRPPRQPNVGNAP